ncbi:hypothetical protein B0H13DRAFT_2369017 [Mycena leptocephala]|nr:hypothetical protein B0H13DRAFT_2369017 [Mycena leptocephala]
MADDGYLQIFPHFDGVPGSLCMKCKKVAAAESDQQLLDLGHFRATSLSRYRSSRLSDCPSSLQPFTSYSAATVLRRYCPWDSCLPYSIRLIPSLGPRLRKALLSPRSRRFSLHRFSPSSSPVDLTLHLRPSRPPLLCPSSPPLLPDPQIVFYLSLFFMVGGVAILFARFYTWRIRIFPEETHKQHMGDRAVDGRHPRPAPTAYRSVKHAGPLCPLPSCHSCRPTTRHAIPTAYTICVAPLAIPGAMSAPLICWRPRRRFTQGTGRIRRGVGGVRGEEWGDGWGREWESGVDAAECEGAGGMVWAVIGSGGRDGARAGGREGGVNGREREREGTREQEMDGGGSPVSISISAPLLARRQGTSIPVRTASPQAVQSAPGHWGPQSRRKGSTDEVEPERERDGKDKEKSGVAFPFHFGGAAAQSKPLPPAHSPLDAPLLAPPHIILEPASPAHDQGGSCASTLELHAPVAPGGDGKRAPQIVYAAGFVNHLATPALSDPHPPGDRAVGVRDLLVVGVIGWGEEEEAAGNMEEGGAALIGGGEISALGVAGAGAFALGGVFSREGTAAPKGRIEKGTLEALIHGLVFATVFLRTALEAEEAAQREEEWRDYALVVLLCLPLLVDRARVETELICCAGYLVSPQAHWLVGRRVLAASWWTMKDSVEARAVLGCCAEEPASYLYPSSPSAERTTGSTWKMWVEAPRAPPAPTLTFPGMESIVVTAVLKFPELPVSFTPADCAAWLATAARIIPELEWRRIYLHKRSIRVDYFVDFASAEVALKVKGLLSPKEGEIREAVFVGPTEYGDVQQKLRVALEQAATKTEKPPAPYAGGRYLRPERRVSLLGDTGRYQPGRAYSMRGTTMLLDVVLEAIGNLESACVINVAGNLSAYACPLTVPPPLGYARECASRQSQNGRCPPLPIVTALKAISGDINGLAIGTVLAGTQLSTPASFEATALPAAPLRPLHPAAASRRIPAPQLASQRHTHIAYTHGHRRRSIWRHRTAWRAVVAATSRPLHPAASRHVLAPRWLPTPHPLRIHPRPLTPRLISCHRTACGAAVAAASRLRIPPHLNTLKYIILKI